MSKPSDINMPEKVPFPAKIRALWLAALRSGVYKRTTGTLYNPKTGGFCCLGVLEKCVLDGVEYYEHGVPRLPKDMPTRKFWEYIGIRYNKHGFNGPFERLVGELATQNDDGVRFAKIADYIEEVTEPV